MYEMKKKPPSKREASGETKPHTRWKGYAVS